MLGEREVQWLSRAHNSPGTFFMGKVAQKWHTLLFGIFRGLAEASPCWVSWLLCIPFFGTQHPSIPCIGWRALGTSLRTVDSFRWHSSYKLGAAVCPLVYHQGLSVALALNIFLWKQDFGSNMSSRHFWKFYPRYVMGNHNYVIMLSSPCTWEASCSLISGEELWNRTKWSWIKLLFAFKQTKGSENHFAFWPLFTENHFMCYSSSDMRCF